VLKALQRYRKNVRAGEKDAVKLVAILERVKQYAAKEGAPVVAISAKLESEIKNWTRFIDAKGIKAE